MAFQYPGFQEPGFQTGETTPVGGSSAPRADKIPRWLLSFERMGRIINLSDVGGEVQGTAYFPAILDVNFSDVTIDLERMTIPKFSCSVSVSPSSLEEHFISVKELGKAKVTVASWDGHTIRPVLQADMEELALGYDGDVITFRLTEDFYYNPIFPEGMVNFDTFDRDAMVDGARFHAYTQAWGDAVQVPAFAVIEIGGGTQRWMIVGHNANPLPTQGSGTPARFKDKLGTTYVGADLGNPVGPYYTFNNSYGIDKAGDLLRALIEKHSTYPDTLVDHHQLDRLYNYLNQFNMGGYVDQEGPLFEMIERRMHREWLFVVYQQGGMLRGTPIDPMAPARKTLVYNKHLLQLDEPKTEDIKYTHFKIRYRWRSKPPNPGWYGVSDIGLFNDGYLKQMALRWGNTLFGDPVEWKRHAPSVDCADVETDATAISIRTLYARLHHRGSRYKYLQEASGADTPLGTVVGLVDPERGLDGKRAILIGRKWVTPELIVQTYRTLEKYELTGTEKQSELAKPPPFTYVPIHDVFDEGWEFIYAPLHSVFDEPWEYVLTLLVREEWELPNATTLLLREEWEISGGTVTTLLVREEWEISGGSVITLLLREEWSISGSVPTLLLREEWNATLSSLSLLTREEWES